MIQRTAAGPGWHGRQNAITFTRKAANQIKSRVGSTLAAANQSARPGTRLIRIYAKRLGLRAGFTTLDRDDSIGLMTIVRRDCGLAERELEFPKAGTCLDIYSRVINAQ